MEIYVAKKAEFQPLLYETLPAGFDLKKVRSHFRSKTEAIRRLSISAQPYCARKQ
ncbi:MAG TPA: hypothetical protein VN966_05615 [Candidatus Bathyarchaeia archaeon]|nr:hypothetical protein [Candidatus Bathyarchaeia archaeon]